MFYSRSHHPCSSPQQKIIGNSLLFLQYDLFGVTAFVIISHFCFRVNFLKYKKPEKDLSNLNRSEVFKIIHHIEREPRAGIPARPEKVMAADDVIRVSHDIRKLKNTLESIQYFSFKYFQCSTPMTCQ